MRKKRMYAIFALFDRTGVQSFLERQAEKGWMLTSVKNYFWYFSRKQSETLSYSITYFPKPADESQKLKDEQMEFIDFCSLAGWKLAAVNDTMHVFYSTEENPVPLETDPEVELETIHRAVRKTNRALIATAVLAAVNLLLRGLQLTLAHIYDQYIYPVEVFSAFVWFALGAVSLYQIFQYFHWRRMAKKSIASGTGFFPTKSRPGLVLCTVISIIVFCVMFYFLFKALSPLFGISCGISVLFVLGLRVLLNAPENQRDTHWSSFFDCLRVLGIFLCLIGVVLSIALPIILLYLGLLN